MSTKNPWKTIDSHEIYTNAWIRLREDQVITPSGQSGIYGVLECRKACGVLALTAKEEVWLVGQYRYPTKTYSWEIIEGGAEDDEQPLDCAKRELKEEAGLIAKSWKPLGGVVQLSNSHSDELAYFFLAQELVLSESSPDPTEVLQTKKLPLAEVKEMVVEGEITDAMSIIAIGRL